jgi:hypothetical protein
VSRSGYSDGLEHWDLIRWRGAVKAALRGKRGQAFLRELIETLDAMPEKKLAYGRLFPPGPIDPDCTLCAMGEVAKRRGLNLRSVDIDEPEEVGDALGIARAMAAEIAYMNDEASIIPETEERRWQRMHNWAKNNLSPSPQ